jgi:hypothetical protein
MGFQNLYGKEIAFHKAYNYLYRPLALKEIYSETKYVNISEAKKLGLKYIEYTENHAFCQYEGVVYQTITAVPLFPWSWLVSTKSFLTSILDPIDKAATDQSKKQEYAFHFLILFVPFRSREDLGTEGCSQNAFQNAHKEGRITDEMIHIAENIQTLHNSLSSGIPENSLSELVREDNLKITTEDDKEDNFDDDMASIRELFATLSSGDELKEDFKCLVIQFGNKQMESTSIAKTELETVIKFHNSE